MHHFYHTIDIKLASCLDSLGIPFRTSDPVTRVQQIKNGRPFEQCTFWFDTTDNTVRGRCKDIVEAYFTAEPMFQWKKQKRLHPHNTPDAPPKPIVEYYKFDPESAIYYQMDALFMREVWLHWSRNDAELMKIVAEGNKTITLSVRASKETKEKIKLHI